MILGRVIGNVVCTRKHEILEGHKIMLVKPIDPDRKSRNGVVIALDVVQAGVGDSVLIIDEGNSARLIIDDPTAPVRTVIVGIVDSLDIME